MSEYTVNLLSAWMKQFLDHFHEFSRLFLWILETLPDSRRVSLQRIFLTRPRHFFIPGLDNTRLFMSFTAGAGTRCMSLLSSSPILLYSSLTIIHIFCNSIMK
jgi:hypothetical protein